MFNQEQNVPETNRGPKGAHPIGKFCVIVNKYYDVLFYGGM